MMPSNKELMLCYNRGCGKKFNPIDNKPDSCIYHAGHPVFHDAYKTWSCCNKKCTDFTEFLNIKGCTKSFHSNEKPPEPEKPNVDKLKLDEVIEYRAPVSKSSMKRPSFNITQVTMIPTISPTLLQQIKDCTENLSASQSDNNVKIGQSCRNTTCKAVYQGPQSNEEICNYHSGVAIFHEGLKYWSCCKKKTTDFSVFLAQSGCTQGTHLWIAQNSEKKVQCRMDWHQTGSFVIVSVYAKKYEPSKTSIKLNPIRLTTSIFFPIENSYHDMDLELRGIIDIEKSSVNMTPTKIEIKLKKAEPGTWTELHFPLAVTNKSEDSNTTSSNSAVDSISNCVDAVDLNDL